MYDINKKHDQLIDVLAQGCENCGFKAKCYQNDYEVGKCFKYLVESEVRKILNKNNMDIDMWTCYGKMSIYDLIHLLIYLEKEQGEQ